MFHYEYVSKEEAKPFKEEFERIIDFVEEKLQDLFSFKYKFIGSSARNMITVDWCQGKGFDFDIDLYVMDGDDEYSPKRIKEKIMAAINKKIRMDGLAYNDCEDNTRVITVKRDCALPARDISWFGARLYYSCDIAIVREVRDHNGEWQKEYIRHNKKQNTYTWERSGNGYHLEEKEPFLKKNGHWNDVRDCYLDKKNFNTDMNKKSRALYAEAVHEVWQYWRERD